MEDLFVCQRNENFFSSSSNFQFPRNFFSSASSRSSRQKFQQIHDTRLNWIKNHRSTEYSNKHEISNRCCVLSLTKFASLKKRDVDPLSLSLFFCYATLTLENVRRFPFRQFESLKGWWNNETIVNTPCVCVPRLLKRQGTRRSSSSSSSSLCFLSRIEDNGT